MRTLSKTICLLTAMLLLAVSFACTPVMTLSETERTPEPAATSIPAAKPAGPAENLPGQTEENE